MHADARASGPSRRRGILASMLDVIPILRSQFRAALLMLEQCIERCPEGLWDAQVAKYPVWQVVHHVLSFVDCYLSPSDQAFIALMASRAAAREADGTPAFNPQPAGIAELAEEYPSRRFSRDEMLTYVRLGREKADAVLAAETDAALTGPSGFPRLPFPRLELHLYNLRHIQHHAGQLSAVLRREGIDTDWVGRGKIA